MRVTRGISTPAGVEYVGCREQSQVDLVASINLSSLHNRGPLESSLDLDRLALKGADWNCDHSP